MNTSTWFVDTPILDNFSMQRPMIWTVFIYLHQSASVIISRPQLVSLSINQHISQHQSASVSVSQLKKQYTYHHQIAYVSIYISLSISIKDILLSEPISDKTLFALFNEYFFSIL